MTEDNKDLECNNNSPQENVKNNCSCGANDENCSCNCGHEHNCKCNAEKGHNETKQRTGCHCHEEEKSRAKESNKPKEAPATQKRQKRVWSESALTQLEAFLMFIVVIAVTLSFAINMQRTQINTYNNTIDSLETVRLHIMDLETKVEDLERSLKELDKAGEKDPINITIDLDGLKHEVSYPSTDAPETDADEPGQPEQLPPEFDISPFLGVGFIEGNDGSGNPLGVQIDHVYESSPAEFAGLKAGDVITSVDGIRVNTTNDLTSIIGQHAANDVISINVITTSEYGVNYITVNATLTYKGNFDLG